MIYRVILKVGYHEAHFDFEAVEDAATFARVALAHMVDCDDTKKKPSITMLIINPTKESECFKWDDSIAAKKYESKEDD